MRIPSGVTDQYIYFVAVDATDLKTRETGLSSFTVYRSRNGDTATAYTTPTVIELSSGNMPGVYALLLDEDMTIDAGNDAEEVCVHITHAGMSPVTRVFELYRPKLTAGETLTVSSGSGNAAVQSIGSGAFDAVRTAVGLASANLDTQLGTIDDNVDAIKAKTDDLTFTEAGAVDANVQYVNDVEVAGDGQPGTEWGPSS